MTPTPHGQVPEALIDLIDAYAETRHRYGGIYNAKTEAARKAVIEDLREALGGVQALSAAPAEADMFWDAEDGERFGHDIDDIISDFGPGDRVKINCAKRMPSIEVLVVEDGDDFTYQIISPTPPAEQQATKETSGGFHVWRDISTAPKDGSRFVAIGYNYGLYSEGRHICVAQWFRGCWMETSDWNEASELQHLTHWLPLPSPPDDVAAPAEQQATTTEAALGVEPVSVYAKLPEALLTQYDDIDGEEFGCFAEGQMRDFADRTHALRMQAAPKAAPGEQLGYKQALGSNNCMQCCVSYMLGLPLADVPHFADGGGWGQFASFVESKGYSTVMLPGEHEPEADYLASGRTERGTPHMVVMNGGKLVFDPHPSCSGLSSVQCVWLLAKRAAPQPAPAPLSDDTERLEWLLWKLPGDALRYVVGELSDTSSGAEFRAAIDAAIAAQGGKV